MVWLTETLRTDLDLRARVQMRARPAQRHAPRWQSRPPRNDLAACSCGPAPAQLVLPSYSNEFYRFCEGIPTRGSDRG